MQPLSNARVDKFQFARLTNSEATVELQKKKTSTRARFNSRISGGGAVPSHNGNTDTKITRFCTAGWRPCRINFSMRPRNAENHVWSGRTRGKMRKIQKNRLTKFKSRRLGSMEDWTRALPSVTNHGRGPVDLHQPKPLCDRRHLTTAKQSKSSNDRKGLSTFIELSGCLSPCPRKLLKSKT
jgi:hypothetical protein